MSENLRIGWALCGSFCTIAAVCDEMERFVAAGAQVTPIVSDNVATVDTRFGTAQSVCARLSTITGKEPLCTLPAVEPIGPKGWFDVLVVAPCTGTTLGKLANGISNTPVTLAVKSHLRSGRPVVLAVATNDALGASMRNIALLKNTKHLFFVPMAQDDAAKKPNSLVAVWEQIAPTVSAALAGTQIQPLWWV